MAFVDPVGVQNPTTNLVATFGWGDAVNTAFNWLHAAKAGCHVTTSVATAIGTDTVIPFATETFDVNACHSTSSNTGRITVPTNWAGLWAFGANIRTTNDLFTVWLRVNGTTKIAGQAVNVSGAVAGATSVVMIYDMAVGDYCEVVITGAGTIDTAITNYFWGYFLHG